jgi:hypothetical protein
MGNQNKRPTDQNKRPTKMSTQNQPQNQPQSFEPYQKSRQELSVILSIADDGTIARMNADMVSRKLEDVYLFDFYNLFFNGRFSDKHCPEERLHKDKVIEHFRSAITRDTELQYLGPERRDDDGLLITKTALELHKYMSVKHYRKLFMRCWRERPYVFTECLTRI